MATTVKVPMARVAGLDELFRTLRRLPKEASDELRTRSRAIADEQADTLKRAAASHPDRRVRQVAGTVRSRRDRVPVVVVGGAKRLELSGRPQAGEVLFGTEWGAQPDGPNGWRFPSATDGEWLTPTLREHHRDVVEQWQELATDVINRWAR